MIISFSLFLLLLGCFFYHFSPEQRPQIAQSTFMGLANVSAVISNQKHDCKTDKICCNQRQHTVNERNFQIFLTILGGIIAGIIGVVVGLFLNWIQRRDEKALEIENRCRNFLANMKQIHLESTLINCADMGEIYKNIFPRIIYHAGLIQGDFINDIEGFEECLARFYRLDGIKIEKPHNQAEIIQAIELFIGFVEGNFKHKETK